MDHSQQVIQSLLQTTIFILSVLVILFAVFSMYIIYYLLSERKQKQESAPAQKESALFNMEEIITTTKKEGPSKRPWVE